MPKSHKTISRRAIIATTLAAPAAAIPNILPTAAAAPASSPIAAAVVDPIFAGIEAMKAAEVAHGDAIDVQSVLKEELPKELTRSYITRYEEEIEADDDPRWIAALRAVNAASDAVNQRACDLLDIMPTTFQGVSALLRFASGYLGEGYEWPDDVLEHVANSLDLLITATAQGGADADARILRLGQEMQVAGKIYPDDGAELQRCSENVSRVAREIATTRALSIEGLRVKARAVAWCHGGEPISLCDPEDSKATDIRITESILADLLAA